MKYLHVTIISVIISFAVKGQNTDLNKIDSSRFIHETELFGTVKLTPTPDTIITNGGAFAVIITENTMNDVSFYSFNDPTKNITTLPKSRINSIIDNRKDRTFLDLEKRDLIGHQVFMEIIPFKPGFSKYVHLKADLGINEYSGVFMVAGEPLRFRSEFSAINFIISRGWKLHKILVLDKGSIGGASSLGLSSAFGGSINISTTKYIFTKTLQ